MKKHYKRIKTAVLCSIALVSFTIDASAQIVNIPDANFKGYLVGNTAINTNADAEIQVSEAAAFTGNIFGNNLGITNLTGIEAFTSLTGLYCRDNNIGSIDISANTALTFIDCQSANLSTLDISVNTALEGVVCSYNSITSLDVSNNTALTAIQCSGNNITSLDVTNNTLLSNFACDNNAITSLDLSNNTALLYFVCPFNSLTSLDLSNNTALVHFSCAGNNLSSLNMANGNNVSIGGFYSSLNPNLTCIQVDDVAWSTTNWTNIDAASSFSLNCGLGINDQTFENISIYPNPVISQLTLESEELIEKITIVNSLGRIVGTIVHPKNTIDLSHLSDGIYFLQVNLENGVMNKKFIKK